MEIQLEEDYSERQHIMREKRNLEQKVAELQDRKSSGDKDTERRLRKDLKKTKALLNDAQLMLDKQKASAPSSGKLKQLKNDVSFHYDWFWSNIQSNRGHLYLITTLFVPFWNSQLSSLPTFQYCKHNQRISSPICYLITALIWKSRECNMCPIFFDQDCRLFSFNSPLLDILSKNKKLTLNVLG